MTRDRDRDDPSPDRGMKPSVRWAVSDRHKDEDAEVAELADAADSKSAEVTPREGSTPSFGTGGRVKHKMVAAAVMTLLCLVLACDGNANPCGPTTPFDAGGCGQSYGVDYDPATQTGCVFVNGSGTASTCAALCGQPATCDQLTFTSVICDVPCGD